jgi:hypothetical protein
MTRHFEQSVQARHCAGRDHVEFPLHSFDLALSNANLWEAQFRYSATEEIGPQLAWFVEHHWPPTENGDDKPWQSRSRTDIEPAALVSEAKQLRAVEDVTFPQFWNALGRDQILAPILLDEQRSECL